MRTFFAGLTLTTWLLAACGGESPPPQLPPPPPPPATASATAPPVDTAPPAPRAGDKCGDQICTPPARCESYSGMTPNSVRQACVIRCGADKSCPAGKKCTMIYDGPGEVCE